MSQKFPFTPDGVQQKQAELYSLADDQLLAQAQSIACGGLMKWLEENFQLTDDQISYLNTVPANPMFAWGAQISSAVIGRLEITMDIIPAELSVSKAANSKKKTSVSGSVNVSHNPATGQTTYGGSISVGFSFGG